MFSLWTSRTSIGCCPFISNLWTAFSFDVSLIQRFIILEAFWQKMVIHVSYNRSHTQYKIDKMKLHADIAFQLVLLELQADYVNKSFSPNITLRLHLSKSCLQYKQIAQRPNCKKKNKIKTCSTNDRSSVKSTNQFVGEEFYN